MIKERKAASGGSVSRNYEKEKERIKRRLARRMNRRKEKGLLMVQPGADDLCFVQKLCFSFSLSLSLFRVIMPTILFQSAVLSLLIIQGGARMLMGFFMPLWSCVVVTCV